MKGFLKKKPKTLFPHHISSLNLKKSFLKTQVTGKLFILTKETKVFCAQTVCSEMSSGSSRDACEADSFFLDPLLSPPHSFDVQPAPPINAERDTGSVQSEDSVQGQGPSLWAGQLWALSSLSWGYWHPLWLPLKVL